MKKLLQSALALVVLAVAAWLGIDLGDQGGSQPTATAPSATTADAQHAPQGDLDRDLQRLARAAQARESGFMVTVPGEVIRLLPDDNEGSRHQKFLVRLANRQTLLVAHNIDLAKRVPLQRGDQLGLRGQYEWNDRGGVLHWTHHDPKGWRDGGWIDHNGVRYE